MLPPEIEAQLREIATADIVVGVPTYNNARSVGPVVDAVRGGLVKYFPDARAVVVNSDAGSTDDTPALVADGDWPIPCVLARHEAPPGELVAIPFHGVPGRAAAQRVILEAADRLGARASVIVGSDCRSVRPEWIDRLVRPVLEHGADYVAPLYQRQRYDGTLTNGLIYPLTRALFGRAIRQPLGDHAALSTRLVAYAAAQEIHEPAVVRQGLELWLLAVLAGERFTACEAWLGPCALETSGRATDLATIFAQAIGATFAVIDYTADVWFDIRGAEPVPAVGPALPLGADPVELNRGGMIRAFRLGLKDLLPLWEQILSPDTLTEVLALEPGPEAFGFPHDLWARVVYDFALGYHFRVLYREHLLRSLVPLYLARTAGFVRETVAGTAADAERWIERGCRAFEQQKAYLVERWH